MSCIKIEEILKTFLLFEATFTASLEIKDLTLKHQAKKMFNDWFNQTRRLKKHFLEDVCKNQQMENDYEELAAAAYEFITLTMQANDYNKMLTAIHKELENQSKE
jgi:hypothetical protein